MTPEEQEVVNKFVNSIANLLVSCGTLNFNMNLEEQHVHIDLNGETPDIDLLENVINEINQLNESIS